MRFVTLASILFGLGLAGLTRSGFCDHGELTARLDGRAFLGLDFGQRSGGGGGHLH